MFHETLNAAFTTAKIIVDGVRDEAYSAAEIGRIGCVKAGVNPADHAGKSATRGTVQALWDGRSLYFFVDVTDSTPARNTAYAGKDKSEPVGDADKFDWEKFRKGDRENWHTPGTYEIGDAVEFAVDFWNDKFEKFQDDDGLFSVTRDGFLSYYFNSMVPNHSCVYAHKANREFSGRIRAWAAREKQDGSGYCVELAFALYARDWEYDEAGTLQAREVPVTNGSRYGFDFMIGDSLRDDTPRDARVYWSHTRNDLPFSSKDYNADWGEIVLAGWKGEPFAPDDWHLREAIRFAQSPSLQEGVWRADMQRELDGALEGARGAMGLADQDRVDAAARRLYAAVEALRWKDETYPDPLDLKPQFTLPNPYRFMDGRPVRSVEDWPARRREILALAQHYEYGKKPPAPDRIEIDGISLAAETAFSFHTGTEREISFYRVDVTAWCGGVSASTAFRLRLPEEERLRELGRTGKLPVVLSFRAEAEEYLRAGYAVFEIPTGDITDDRVNPWVERTGFMRLFYPYDRASTQETGNEMAAAWECSVAIDALERLTAGHHEIGARGDAGSLLAADMLAVTGFSICGKYAFVSALFDERIGVCIPGAAGASGPSLYRFATPRGGLRWSWGRSTGSEVLGDTIRHNPGRGIELFRRFLTPGRFYKVFDGKFGYGERLPYDHEELVATLCPRAIVLQSCVDDYSDQSAGDALSLTLAKSVYGWLGRDKDMLVMHNFRAGTDHGARAHMEDAPQRARTAEYLDWFFFGVPLSEATRRHLQTDPFLADEIDGADGYARNFGGLSAMAPWLGAEP